MQDPWGSANPREFSVFRDGLWFSVLRPSSETEEALIYLHSYKRFIGRVNLSEDLDPGAVIKEDERLELPRTQKVGFLVKEVIEGYQLGLELPDWWWQKNREWCPAVVAEEKEEWAPETTRIALAIVPYREFDGYWDPIHYRESSKFKSKVFETGEEQRKKFGWVETKDYRQLRLGIVHLPGPWTQMSNRYFEVHHSPYSLIFP